MKFNAVRGAAATIAAIAWLAALPAAATDFVQDQAGMFSAATVAQLNERIGSFNAATGKEIVVVTTPSLGGASVASAAANAFAEQHINGVLIFVARDDRRDIILPDRAGTQAGWFTPAVTREIRTAMESQFRAENYDAGIIGAVDAVLGIYRSHAAGGQPTAAGSPARLARSQGVHLPMFWWIVIAVVGFLLIRSILRAASAPRNYGAPPPAGAPPGGGGYGPGYGPGYGYGGFGGGGSFWSGLLGGLGGAWLGNELFRGNSVADASQLGGNTTAPADSGGWQNDAGQADTSGASAGDWSGGGFGGDFGGGSDFGGGGGDSGGGW